MTPEEVFVYDRITWQYKILFWMWLLPLGLLVLTFIAVYFESPYQVLWCLLFGTGLAVSIVCRQAYLNYIAKIRREFNEEDQGDLWRSVMELYDKDKDSQVEELKSKFYIYRK